ncbi:hypothetical protein QTA58_00100 [Neorhizobium sp. CSC1952]|uniref:hypothetical protein n=1 Tax=Neorhizobium TaxID=1525371 RepID=UPI0025A5F932|nr:hypothetical protein [Rhizobium sp. CSC1952]WJR67181.1 hypothetical protein QTA58_23880 [Rhizobium sp. CSC1952]WJR67210.1 hypothetical protein QTA58_00100 [Rhizobium sp. CSC1952]
MTRKPMISAGELKRMAQVANSEGVTVELERDGTIMRVMPFRPPKMIVPKLSREEEAEAALARWKARRKPLPDDFAL